MGQKSTKHIDTFDENVCMGVWNLDNRYCLGDMITAEEFEERDKKEAFIYAQCEKWQKILPHGCEVVTFEGFHFAYTLEGRGYKRMFIEIKDSIPYLLEPGKKKTKFIKEDGSIYLLPDR